MGVEGEGGEGKREAIEGCGRHIGWMKLTQICQYRHSGSLHLMIVKLGKFPTLKGKGKGARRGRGG